MRLRGLMTGVVLAIAWVFVACEGSDAIDSQTGAATDRGGVPQPPAPPPPPASCDLACARQAREAVTTCTEAQGADRGACLRTYAAAIQACGCWQAPPPPPPPVPCDDACATRAREAFTACTHAQGADQLACRTTYVSALEVCGCHPSTSSPPPPPPAPGER
jgi:hypothetical protein